MAPKARNREPVTRWGRNAGDDADRQPFALQQRPLFDMQFNPCMVMICGKNNRCQRTTETRDRAHLGEGTGRVLRYVDLAEHVSLSWIESARKETRPNAADPEPRRLLRRKEKQFNRAARLQTAALESAQCLEAAKNPNRAVVHACVRNGVDVRPGRDSRKLRFSPVPANEGVANSIVTYAKAVGDRQPFQPCAGAKVIGREDDPRDRSSRRIGLDAGETGQCLEFGDKAGFIDLNLHRLPALPK